VQPIEFSQHALDQLCDRGTTKEEVIKTIQEGEKVPVILGVKVNEN
jgi:hypothetical protein